MKFISTRGGSNGVSLTFEEALLSGFAPDGGMMLPERIPQISKEQLKQWSTLKYRELCVEVTSQFIDEDQIPRDDLKKLVDDSFVSFGPKEVVPVVKIEDNFFLSELFHGPTFAFKDLALQFVGNLCNYFLEKRNKRMTILVATSGDTGSAAIHAIRGKKNVECFVLYPKGRISDFQEAQMTTVLDDNIHTMCVDNSTSDDLDEILKILFDDVEFNQQHNLCSINSINWTRIMVQMVHYYWSYFRVRENYLTPDVDSSTFWPEILVSVPTGAFGNAFAGIIAKRMGLPLHRIIVATNENDILNRYFTTGVFSRGNVVKTVSPSIDIQVPYNFERLLYFLADENAKQVTDWMNHFKNTGSLDLGADLLKKSNQWILSTSANNDDTLHVIKHYYDKVNYLLDPHTAVGVKAVEKFRDQKVFDAKIPFVCLATAHACKFADAIKAAVGVDPVPPYPETAPTPGQKTKLTSLTKETAEEPLRKMVHDAFFRQKA